MNIEPEAPAKGSPGGGYAKINYQDLVTPANIADRWNIPVDRVYKWISRSRTGRILVPMPTPVTHVTGHDTPVWYWHDIVAWKRTWEKTQRQRERERR